AGIELAIIDDPRQVVVLPGDAIFAEAGELAETAQQEAALGHVDITVGAPERGADLEAVGPEGERLVGPDFQLLVALIGAQIRFGMAPEDARRIAGAGEVDVIQGVAVDLQGIESFVEVEGGLFRIAHADLGFTPVPRQPEPHLTVVGYLPAEIDTRPIALLAIVGNRVVVQDDLDVAGLGIDEGGKEITGTVVQRLVELAIQLLVFPQLQAGQPLGAQRVDAIDPEACADGELAAALEIVHQVQPQAQVIGAGFPPAGTDQQGVAV